MESSLPVELILTISNYLDLGDVFEYIQIFKNDHEYLSRKLIAWRYPKLFKVLNRPEIIGLDEVFASWDHIIGELNAYKHLYECKESSIKSQIQGVVLNLLLIDATLDCSFILSYVRSIVVEKFDIVYSNPTGNYQERQEITKRDINHSIIVNAGIKLIEYNRKFMLRLLTVLYRNDIGSIPLGIISIWELDLDVIIKLKIRLNKDFSIAILEHIIKSKPEYIQHFIGYLDSKSLNLLLFHNREEYMKINMLKIGIVTYQALDILLIRSKMELFNSIINHPDFKVTRDILKDACGNLNFRLLKVLLNHPSYKG